MHRCKPIAIWKLTAFHYGSTPKGSPKTTAFTLPLPFITLPVMYFTLTMLTADTFLLPYLPEFLLTFRLIVIPVVKCAKFHVPKIQNTGYIYGQSLYIITVSRIADINYSISRIWIYKYIASIFDGRN